MGAVENLLIGGERVPSAEGRTFETVNPATRRGVPHRRGGRARGRRPRRAGRRAGVRGLGRAHAGPAREGALPLGRPDRGARGRARADRDARHGHGDRRRALVRGQRRGGDALLRGRGRQVLRLDDPRRPRRHRPHLPRADRGRRADHAVELPAQHRQLEDGAGDRGREHRRAEAREPLSSLRPSLRGARSRGGAPAGRAQRRPRPRTARWATRSSSTRSSARSGSPARPRSGSRSRARQRARSSASRSSSGARAPASSSPTRIWRRRGGWHRSPSSRTPVRTAAPAPAARRGLGPGGAARALRRRDARDRRRRSRVTGDPGRPPRLGRAAGDRRGVHRPWRRRGRDRAGGRLPAGRTRSSRTASTSARRFSGTARTRWWSRARRSSGRSSP